MSLERLIAARKKTIGTKQTAKAIDKGLAKVVYIARDAEEFVTRDLMKAAQKRSLEVVQIDTMVQLGKACGIEVKAAAAAILEF